MWQQFVVCFCIGLMSTCVTVALFLYLPLKFLCFFLENFQIELQFVLLNLFCGFLMFFTLGVTVFLAFCCLWAVVGGVTATPAFSACSCFRCKVWCWTNSKSTVSRQVASPLSPSRFGITLSLPFFTTPLSRLGNNPRKREQERAAGKAKQVRKLYQGVSHFRYPVVLSVEGIALRVFRIETN